MAMGWLANKQEEAGKLIGAALGPLVPAGEQLLGAMCGGQQKMFKLRTFAIGVTDQHLLIQEVDRSVRPVGPGVVATRDEVETGNIFREGAGFTLTSKDEQIRFTAKGVEYKLRVLGGTFLENKLAGRGQVEGLYAVADFLRSAG